MGNEQGKALSGATPAGIHSMDESLQKKFSKGIQYNMKILIRGDRNSGKSCLYERMQGKKYCESYTPTDEIQVTSILWSYKVTNDTVKVEVWDVVDKGRVAKKKKGLLKFTNDTSESDSKQDVPLDAEFLDVYKGAHGVVFLFDMTKVWTWKYVERGLEDVPLHIPVMVLANFRDHGEHRTVAREDCITFIQYLQRPEGAADVRYAECSMKDGFGLMHLHKFLSIPFLQLQQETLLQQLQVSRQQSLSAKEELNAALATDDQNYELYQAKVQEMAEGRRQKAEAIAKRELPAGDESPASPIRRTSLENKAGAHKTDPAPSPTPSPATSQPAERSGSTGSKRGSRFSGLFGRGGKGAAVPEPSLPVRKPSAVAASPSAVDDFVPEGEVDFLDSDEEEEDEDDEEEEEDSYDDIDKGNPLIAADEDISTDDEPPPRPPSPPKPRPQEKRPPPITLKSAKEVILTESEEEEEEEDEEEPKMRATKKTAVKKAADFGLLLSHPEPPHAAKPATPKRDGLLLEFAAASKPPPAPRDTTENGVDASGGVADSPSPSASRKERRHKSSRKKSSKKEHAAAAEGGGEGEKRNSAREGDPFGLTSSLDAWLSSGVEDGSSILTPSKSSTIEVGKEEEEEEEEEETRSHRKKKHRRRREEGDEEKPHRKHKHKSRHRGSAGRDHMTVM